LEVTELRNLPENCGSVVDQGRERIIYFKKESTKKENLRFLTFMSRTLGEVLDPWFRIVGVEWLGVWQR
jgi:hypothetical protein